MSSKATQKVAIITCYRDPDYVRARVLRAALAEAPGFEVIVVKNHFTNVLRYPEVLCKIIWTRLRYHPDNYILTFRGYELLPVMWLLAWPRPVILDELVNLLEWVIDEHKKFSNSSLGGKLLAWWYRRQISHYPIVLADTPSHAIYSAQRTNLSIERYIGLLVGTDESLFYPEKKTSKDFIVCYFGNMLPLHGMQYVVEAAVALKDYTQITFQLTGGGPKAEALIEVAQAKGAHIVYKKWVPFDRVAQETRQASIYLAGPFGKTVQSDFVVTGKTYQALACEVPTLIGDNQATNFFTDKSDCIKVPLADSQVVAAAILWAYKHPKELRQIAKAGRKTFDKHASTAVLSKQLALIMQRL